MAEYEKLEEEIRRLKHEVITENIPRPLKNAFSSSFPRRRESRKQLIILDSRLRTLKGTSGKDNIVGFM